MDDLNPQAELPDNNSTVIDADIQGVKSGGGKPAVDPAPEKTESPRKPESARDSLEAEAKKIAAQEDKGDDDDDDAPVAKKEPEKLNAEVKESADKVDANEQEAKASPKPSEGRRNIEAPARFLPNAKDAWRNVPRVVQEEWARVETERETEIAQYREHKQFREEVKDFEELAKRHNVPFKEALNNYVDIERKFSEDPAQGFRQLCQNLGMTPPQAIGHILRSANVSPQQLIEHMQREPHAYTALAPQRQQPIPNQSQQRAPDPEISALKEQVQALHAERLANDVIRPFAQEYPEYHDHEDAIAKVLQSGIIEQIHGTGLSPRGKLEAALFMVAPHVRKATNIEAENGNSVQQPSQRKAPADDLQGGDKSVKSSLGDVTDVAEPERKMSMREMLEDEAKKIGRKAS